MYSFNNSTTLRNFKLRVSRKYNYDKDIQNCKKSYSFAILFLTNQLTWDFWIPYFLSIYITYHNFSHNTLRNWQSSRLVIVYILGFFVVLNFCLTLRWRTWAERVHCVSIQIVRGSLSKKLLITLQLHNIRITYVQYSY